MRVDLHTFVGERFEITGQIKKRNQPYPADATGCSLTMKVRRKRGDDPLLSLTGTVANGGAWTVQVDHGDTDNFTRTELLDYVVLFDEPDPGDDTIVQHGTWKVVRQ